MHYLSSPLISPLTILPQLRLAQLTIGLVAAASLAGCASPPRPQSIAPIKSANSYDATISFAAPNGEWPGDNWWEQQEDPQLAVLIKEGLRGASDIRVAAARLARARAYISNSRSTLSPQVSVNGSSAMVRQSENYLIPKGFGPSGWNDYAEADVSLNWSLDFWGKNRAYLSAAKSEAFAASAEAAATRLAVSSAIAQSYADLADLYNERDSIADAVKVRQRSVELVSNRRDSGLENKGAVDRSRSAAASAEADLAGADEKIALVKNQLAALIGAGPDRGRQIQRPVLKIIDQFSLPLDTSVNLIGRRPDIVAARYRVEASSERINAARAAFYPAVNLSALAGFQALGIGNLFNSGSDYGSVGPAISLPIFDGGNLKSQYRGAEADYDEAVANYNASLTRAFHEIADVLASGNALKTRLVHSREAAENARSAWEIARNRYTGGLGSYLDVLTAEDQLISANRTVARLNARGQKLHFSLIRALGGGFQANAAPRSNPDGL